MTVLDILVLVLVGAFIASRFLGFKLPKDTTLKNRKRRPGRAGRVLDFPKAPAAEAKLPAPAAASPVQPVKKVDVSHLKGIEKLKALEGDFSEKSFLEGAKKAYTYYYENLAKGDEGALEHLLAPRLMEEIAEQLERDGTPKAQPITDLKAETADVRVSGRSAVIDVSFGAKHGNDTRKSVWTLARPLGSEDPNWEVQAIQPLS